MKGKKRGRVAAQQQQRLHLKAKGMKVSTKHGGGGGGGGGAAHATTLEQEMDDEFLLEQAAKRRRAPKQRRRQGEGEGDEEGVIGAGMSARILKEARKQQQEVAREMEKERGLDGAREAFDLAAAVAAREREQEEREEEAGEEGEEREASPLPPILSPVRSPPSPSVPRLVIPTPSFPSPPRPYFPHLPLFPYPTFSCVRCLAQSRRLVVIWHLILPRVLVAPWQADEVTEEDERAIAVFLAGGGAAPRQRTLADVIMAKIQEATAGGAAGAAGGAGGGGGVRGGEGGEEAERRIPGVDEKVMEVYRGVGKLLSRYRSGKVPKAFKIVPALSNWEDVLFLTDPDSWTPAAVFADGLD
ncbi:unnamed protein product [Closterium sp. Naga37s-1]|nr:unnamed protein product [Closterium sp. Naga37s-1]